MFVRSTSIDSVLTCYDSFVVELKQQEDEDRKKMGQIKMPDKLLTDRFI